ncbi:MAG: polysaccharide biosynthesis C-terminal domain-containing protein [Candidatus Peregrinibacteria bacterium]
MRNIAKGILGNTFAQIFGKAGTAVLALFTVRILSTYFETSEFGDYGTIYEFLAFFGAVADMGVYTLALREMSKYEENRSEIYSSAFSLRLILTTGAMMLSIVGAFLVPAYMGTLIPSGVILAAVATFFVLMSGTVSVVLQLFWKMRFYSHALIAGKLITFLGIVLITQYWSRSSTTESFYAVLGMGILGSVFTFGMTFYLTEREIPLRFSMDTQKIWNLFTQSLPFGISMILGTLYFRMGFLLLGFLLPRSQDGICTGDFCGDLESGKYYVAIRMMEVLLLLPLFFMNSVLPLLAKSIADASKRVPQILQSSFLFLLALGLPMAGGGIMLASQLCSALADKKLLTDSVLGIIGADTAFQILCIPLFFSFLSSFFNYALISYNRQNNVMWTNAVALGINFISNLILIPQYGLLGAAISAVISEAVVTALGWFFLSRKILFLPPLLPSFKIFIATGIMATGIFIFEKIIPVFLPSSVILLLMIGFATVLYLGSLFFLKFFTPEMKAILKKSNPQEEMVAGL